MENFIFYYDPLFSIICIIFLIFLVLLVDYYRMKLKNKAKEETLERLRDNLKSTQHEGKEEDKFILYLGGFISHNDGVNKLLQIARGYLSMGSYQDAIKVYLLLLEGNVINIEILDELANVYFKSTLYSRSKEILERILKTHPRRIKSLELLKLLYIKEGRYKDALQTIVAIKEIEGELIEEDLEESIKENYDEDIVMLIMETNVKNIFLKMTTYIKTNRMNLARIAINRLKTLDRELFLEGAELFDLRDIVDFVYEDIEIAKANAMRLAFEEQGFNLSFSYECNKCKINTPFYDFKCPYCDELGSLKLQIKLNKFKRNAVSEKDSSYLLRWFKSR